MSETGEIDWETLWVIYVTGCEEVYWKGIKLPWEVLLPMEEIK